MKKLGFLCLFWTGVLFPLGAQITITNAVFPAAGDTLRYALDNQPGEIVITPPGGGQQWDFSSLRPLLTWEVLFKDARTGTASESFPTATLFYEPISGALETYLSVSAQEVAVLGSSGDDPVGLGLELITPFNPPLVVSRAPVSFFDINQVSSGLLVPFSIDLLPSEIIGQLPVRPDSMRIRIAISRLDAVDAWGNLTIPGGTFDVLRQKRTQYQETRLDAKVPPLGWLDITDLAIQSLGLTTLGVDTTVTYHFLNDQSREAIAICTTDNSQLRVVSVQYKNLDLTTGTNAPQRPGADLTVFPNPAKEVLNIRAGNVPPGDYTLIIYSLPGKEVYRQPCTVTDNRLEEELAIAHLEKGVYVCKFSTAGEALGQAVFIKQ